MSNRDIARGLSLGEVVIDTEYIRLYDADAGHVRLLAQRSLGVGVYPKGVRSGWCQPASAGVIPGHAGSLRTAGRAFARSGPAVSVVPAAPELTYSSSGWLSGEYDHRSTQIMNVEGDGVTVTEVRGVPGPAEQSSGCR
jgi:hypothetical protein